MLNKDLIHNHKINFHLIHNPNILLLVKHQLMVNNQLNLMLKHWHLGNMLFLYLTNIEDQLLLLNVWLKIQLLLQFYLLHKCMHHFHHHNQMKLVLTTNHHQKMVNLYFFILGHLTGLLVLYNLVKMLFGSMFHIAKPNLLKLLMQQSLK